MIRNINLGQHKDGDLVLVTDQSFDADVKRVEYFREQKLLNIIYDLDHDHPGDLAHFELPDDVAHKVCRKSNIMIMEPHPKTGQMVGYYASLIQIGA
jgi:hypothetical protein